MLLVSRNVSVENISVKFPAVVNLSCCVIFELSKFAYYENHRTVEWAQIFISSPHPLFVAAPPIFVEEVTN